MYDRSYWQNHVLSVDSLYNIIPSDVGKNIYQISAYGEVMSPGTSQDAAHFNKIEEMLFALENTSNLLINFSRQNKWLMDEYTEKNNVDIPALKKAVNTIEKGTVTLTNTLKFPFNNSQKTVSLSETRDNGDYVVITEVQSASGNIGEIIISETLKNGFKIAYTGSAASVTIKYKIIGGYTA